MRLSPHFLLSEFTVTTRSDGQDVDGDGDRTEPFPNVPTPEAEANLRVLCDRVLEPIRKLLGVPMRITSGYRSDALNTAIKGSKTSQHRFGEAADFVPVGMTAEAAMEKIAAEVKAKRLTVDQLIVYAGGFVHVSYTRSRANRNQLLRSLADSGSGGPYEAWKVRGAAA